MSDYKIIGGDQREYGPVSTVEIAQWIQQGRANGDTQVQAIGSEDWGPLRDVPELTPALAATAGPPPMPPGGGRGTAASTHNHPLSAHALLQSAAHGGSTDGRIERPITHLFNRRLLQPRLAADDG